MANFSKIVPVIAIALISTACSESSDGPGGGTTYNFTAAISAVLESTSLATAQIQNILSQSFKKVFALSDSPTFSRTTAEAPPVCTDSVCFTPSALTGKYFGVGLMIQSAGNGMNAYFGQEIWSDISATSTTYDFDMSTPLTETGDLTCCTGTGDFTNENTYFSDVIYLFGYMDATFEVTSGSGARRV